MTLLESVTEHAKQQHDEQWSFLNGNSIAFLGINLIYRALHKNKKNMKEAVLKKIKHLIESANERKDDNITVNTIYHTQTANNYIGMNTKREKDHDADQADFQAFKANYLFIRKLLQHEDEAETYDEAVRAHFKTAENYRTVRENIIESIYEYHMARNKAPGRININIISPAKTREFMKQQSLKDVQRIFPEYNQLKLEI